MKFTYGLIYLIVNLHLFYMKIDKIYIYNRKNQRFIFKIYNIIFKNIYTSHVQINT
jgi:hypothetical protein